MFTSPLGEKEYGAVGGKGIIFSEKREGEKGSGARPGGVKKWEASSFETRNEPRGKIPAVPGNGSQCSVESARICCP